MAAAKKKPVAVEVPGISVPERRFELILTSSIETGRNIRKEFDVGKHDALVASIKANGILEPLLVMHGPKSGEFVLIAGERRFRAAKSLDLKEMPCFVYPPLEDPQLYDIMMTENLLRSDLNAVEEAEGIQKLLELGMKQEELGSRMGRSQEYISNRLRLLDSPTVLQEKIISREINPSHVLALLSMKEYAFFDDYVNYFVMMNDKRVEAGDGSFTVKDISSGTVFGSYVTYSSDQNNMKLFFRMDNVYSELGVWSSSLKCSDCEKKKVYPGIYHGICFDQICFKNLIEKIKKEQEEKKEIDKKSKVSSYDISTWLKAKEGTAKPENLDVIPFYKPKDYNFSDRPVSIKDCEKKGCEHCDSEKGVCKDPECFVKEYKAAMKQRRVDSKAYQKSLETAIGNTVFALTEDDILNILAGRHEICGAELRDVNKFFGTGYKDLAGIPRITKLQFYIASFFRSKYASISATQYSKRIVEEFTNDAKRYGLKIDAFQDILNKEA